jgi:tRNA pseudouridine55 synthase
LARQGKTVSLTACPVHIHTLSFTLSSPENDQVDFTISCSAGTYIRCVAHELGRRLGCGAHLVKLRRTQSGEFSLRHALLLSEFNELDPGELAPRVIPLHQVLSEFPVLRVDAETEAAIAQGRAFSCGNSRAQPRSGGDDWHRVLSSKGLLIALAKPLAPSANDVDHSTAVLWHPAVVLIPRNGS